MDGHIIYCISNASTDFYENTLTSFTNFFPKNFDFFKRRWEIGVSTFGLDLNIEEKLEMDMIQISETTQLLPKLGILQFCTQIFFEKRGILLSQREKY